MTLHEVAQQMVGKPRGILAADESTGTMGKRLADVGLENTEEHRQQFRGLLSQAEGLGEYISGVILFTETLPQTNDAGTPIPQAFQAMNVFPGVKVDLGLEDQENGEKLTKGLDGLPDRLREYVGHGAKFTKWRAVIMISDDFPTDANIEESARRLAQYAKDSQDAGLVPIVEPEVLMDGSHEIARCREVTTKTLKAVFSQLDEHGVDIKGMVLKPNMIAPGKDAPKASAEEVAAETVAVLQECLPDDLPGVTFLSGGIGDEDVTQYLNAMNKNHGGTPWNLTFSFGRGLQRTAFAAYGKGDKAGAQAAVLERAKASSDATVGKYA